MPHLLHPSSLCCPWRTFRHASWGAIPHPTSGGDGDVTQPWSSYKLCGNGVLAFLSQPYATEKFAALSSSRIRRTEYSDAQSGEVFWMSWLCGSQEQWAYCINNTNTERRTPPPAPSSLIVASWKGLYQYQMQPSLKAPSRQLQTNPQHRVNQAGFTSHPLTEFPPSPPPNPALTAGGPSKFTDWAGIQAAALAGAVGAVGRPPATRSARGMQQGPP